MSQHLNSPIGLACRLTLRDRARSVVLVVVAAAVAAVIFGLQTIHSSAELALESSVMADHAGRSYVAQAATKDAVAALSGLKDVDTFGVFRAAVFTPTHRVEAPVHVMADPGVPWGVLTDGERPAEGQTALFIALADALEVGIGDTVMLGDPGEVLTVSGILVDPATADRVGALVTDPGTLTMTATAWVSDTGFINFPELESFMVERTITYRSTAALVEDMAANLPPQVTGLTALSSSLGGVGLLLIGVVLVVTVTARRSLREALVYAGISPRISWVVVGLSAGICLAVGSLLGAATAFAGLWVLREPVSALIGQQWIWVKASPWLTLLGTVGAAVACRFMGEGVRCSAALSARVGVAGFSFVRWDRWALAITAVGAALIGVAAASRSAIIPPRQEFVLLAPWGAAMISAALPMGLGLLVRRRLRPATAAVVRHIGVGQYLASGFAIAAAVGGGWYAGFTLHNVDVQESMSAAPQPAGSYAVYEISDTVVDQVAADYTRLGGQKVMKLSLPQEGSLGQVRVTSPTLTRCHTQQPTNILDELPDHCWPQDTASPINIVGLSATAQSVSADPGLIENNYAGLIRFTPDGSGGSVVTTLPDLSAEGADELGGNLPGMVIPTNSPLADELGLMPSGFGMLIMLDFSTLAPEAQAQVRSAVSVAAGAAQTAEGTPFVYYTLMRASGRTAAIGAASVAVVILLIAAATISAAHARTRRILLDLHTSVEHRRHLLLGLFGPTCAAFLLAAALTLLSIRISALPQPGGYGEIWMLPFAAGILVTLLATLIWQQIPPRNQE
ncbi:MAG: hypothetical protein Q4P15_01985 [Propionibacteriaceae bacterium]|nr:hypothetical protein [Propionibacteriaceae bacterium]